MATLDQGQWPQIIVKMTFGPNFTDQPSSPKKGNFRKVVFLLGTSVQTPPPSSGSQCDMVIGLTVYDHKYDNDRN